MASLEAQFTPSFERDANKLAKRYVDDVLDALEAVARHEVLSRTLTVPCNTHQEKFHIGRSRQGHFRFLYLS